MALLNNFVIGCEWTPKHDIACTLLETGNVKISYVSNVITLTKGAFTATIAYTFLADTVVSIMGRISATQGVDIWADDVKGTGNADVTDAAPGATMQIGNNLLLTAAINSPIRNVKVINGDLTDEQVEAL